MQKRVLDPKHLEHMRWCKNQRVQFGASFYFLSLSPTASVSKNQTGGSRVAVTMAARKQSHVSFLGFPLKEQVGDTKQRGADFNTLIST